MPEIRFKFRLQHEAPTRSSNPFPIHFSTQQCLTLLGDPVVAGGFPVTNEFALWRGYLEGTIPARFASPRYHTTETEYKMSGEQLKGMSGGAVLNGAGHVGLVHANWRPDESTHEFPLVIPTKLILQCIDSQMSSNLLPLSNCNETTVLAPPIFFSYRVILHVWARPLEIFLDNRILLPLTECIYENDGSTLLKWIKTWAPWALKPLKMVFYCLRSSWDLFQNVNSAWNVD
jgi:hypothetical protein